MNITRTHLNYYINKKASVKSDTFKALYKTLPTTDIHRLVNLNCDTSSLQRLKRGRPEDKSYKISNLQELVSSFNSRSKSKGELIELLTTTSYSDRVRVAILNRIVRKLIDQN